MFKQTNPNKSKKQTRSICLHKQTLSSRNFNQRIECTTIRNNSLHLRSKMLREKSNQNFTPTGAHKTKFYAIWGSHFQNFTPTGAHNTKFYATWGSQYQILRHLGLTIPNFTPSGAHISKFYATWGSQYQVLRHLGLTIPNLTPSGAHISKFYATWGSQY